MTNKLHHLQYLSDIANNDVEHLLEKERTYKGSWKKRGGVGAFMMLARKWDRLENILGDDGVLKYDIFAAIENDLSGEDGTVLAEVRDLRRYLLLVEAEMTSRPYRTGTPEDNKPGTPEDGGHHAQQEEDQ